MKTKNKRISSFLLFAIFLTAADFSFAQIVGANAFMKGNNVEIGISGIGGFEGAPWDSTTVPLGMHYRSNNPFFGFVANPQLNSWSSFDGDFFTPGSPENGWGFEILFLDLHKGIIALTYSKLTGQLLIGHIQCHKLTVIGKEMQHQRLTFILK